MNKNSDNTSRSSGSFKQTLFDLGQRTKDLVENTKVEILAGGLLFGSIGFYNSYQDNKDRENHIPVAFSEIGKTRKLYAKNGHETPPLTDFYSTTNDLVMKVFEARNASRDGFFENETKAFGRELDRIIDPSLKVHKQLPECASQVVNDAGKAMQSIEKLTSARNDLVAINKELEGSWTESHNDHYRTEKYKKRVRVRKRRYRTVTRTRQVYDHTTHSYAYYPQHGVAAGNLLENFFVKHPDVNLAEHLILATSTEAENEYAMFKSMPQRFQGKSPTPQDYLEVANTWAKGSNLTKYTPIIHKSHEGLKTLSPRWANEKYDAQSVSYNTKSKSDAGPSGYRISQAALKNGHEMRESIEHITSGITFASKKSPELVQKAKDLVEMTTRYKEGDADQKAEEVMDLAQDIYHSNFEAGFDIEPFKWSNVLLWAFSGMAAGAAAGTGIDAFIDNRKRKREDSRYRW